MAKIEVYEDNLDDLIRRYGPLVIAGHDVGACLWSLRKTSTEERVALIEGGFRRVDDFLPQRREDVRGADFYFSDGLGGEYLNLLKILPREKAFLVSGDPTIRDEAQKEGYQVLSEEEILRVINGKHS